MSQSLEKEFVNAGVQSSSEFEVASDEPSNNLVTRRTTNVVSPKFLVDSIVQTQDSACELKPLLNKNHKTSNSTAESCDHHGEENAEGLNSKNVKKTKNKNKKKVMDNNSPDSGTKKLTCDLERKKLEAELKATEQIAKIKQSVIEKRLELELASLQDPCNPNIRPLQHSPNYDLKILENSLERNENLAEKKVPTYRNPLLPPFVPQAPPSSFGQGARSPLQPPFPFPTSSPNQYSKDHPKTKSSKNDSDFLIKNEIKGLKLGPLSTGSPESKYHRSGNVDRPLRNIVLPERGRFMQTIEKPTYSSPQPQMGMNPFKAPIEETKYVHVQQFPVTEAYYTDKMPDRNVSLQQDVQEPGCSPGMTDANSISIWKVLMTKVKRKLKKRSPPWE